MNPSTEMEVTLRQLLAPLEDAAVRVDAHGGIMWFNAAAVRLLGLRRRQDEGQMLRGLLRSAQLKSLMDRDDPAITLDGTAPRDRAICLRFRWLSLDEGGLLLARDVTLHERAEKMRGELTANISHELRTPLSVLGGYLELMEDQRMTLEARKQALADMREQTERMLEMVEGLLELSSMEGQPDQAARDPVPLLALLEEVSAEFRARLADGARLELHGSDALVILGSRKLLASVFRNLLDNACRHLPAAAGVVRVDLEARSGGVCAAVSDNGDGIPAEHLPRITERFYRVDRGRDRRRGGHGLGLAIVKHLLLHHGAELRVRNLKEGGSQFECLFPAWRAPSGDVSNG